MCAYSCICACTFFFGTQRSPCATGSFLGCSRYLMSVCVCVCVCR